MSLLDYVGLSKISATVKETLCGSEAPRQCLALGLGMVWQFALSAAWLPSHNPLSD